MDSLDNKPKRYTDDDPRFQFAFIKKRIIEVKEELNRLNAERVQINAALRAMKDRSTAD